MCAAHPNPAAHPTLQVIGPVSNERQRRIHVNTRCEALICSRTRAGSRACTGVGWGTVHVVIYSATTSRTVCHDRGLEHQVCRKTDPVRLSVSTVVDSLRAIQRGDGRVVVCTAQDRARCLGREYQTRSQRQNQFTVETYAISTVHAIQRI